MTSPLKGIVSFILFVLLVSSCEKETKPPVFDYHDISIPYVDTIKSLCFPDAHCGYAITNLGFYKTIDAGGSWFPIASTTSGIIEFHDRSYGVLPNGRITTDGGDHWMANAPFEFASMTDDGRVVALNKVNIHKSTIYMTGVHDTIYTFVDTLYYNNLNITVFPQVDRIECHMGCFVVIPVDASYNPIIAHNYTTGKEVKVLDDILMGAVDVCGGYNSLMICDEYGRIVLVNLPDEDEAGEFELAEQDKRYDDHTDEYFAIDDYGDFHVAVGRSSIATNKIMKKEPHGFKEMLDPEKNSFTQNFYSIDIIDDNNFVTTTSGGRIYYGTIK